MTAPGPRTAAEFTVPARRVRAAGRIDDEGVLHMGENSPVIENLVTTLDKPHSHDV